MGNVVSLQSCRGGGSLSNTPVSAAAGCVEPACFVPCLSLHPLIIKMPPRPPLSSPAGTNYVETLRVQIHANCRIRRIYFSDRLYAEEDLPAEFKLFLPIAKKE